MSVDYITLADVQWLEQTCLIKGNFLLKSGKKVDTYFDIHRALNKLSSRERLIHMMSIVFNQANKNNATILVGTESSGAVLGAFLAAKHDLDFFLVRKGIREHGTKTMLEAPIGQGQSVILIDDVTSDGQTAINSCGIIQAYGYKVDAVVTAAYRGYGAEERLKDWGTTLWYVSSRQESYIKI